MSARTKRRVALVLAVVGLVPLGLAAISNAAATPQSPEARATLLGTDGSEVGSVTFATGRGGKVEVRVRVEGLSPGFHGFHVHAIGDCSAADFTSAGPHFNPAGVSHPAHAADMPVILVNTDGKAWARFRTDRYSVDDLFDEDNSAVIIHANPDNYANIPADRYDPDPDATTLATGDAGSRVACGEVVPIA